MEIIINNKQAVLKKGTSFDYISENRLFSGADDYTLNISFPLKDCATNLEIFGHINRADIVSDVKRFDCEIRDKNFYKFGTITITEISESEVKTQFLEGRSEQNFDNSLDDIYINELDLGEPENTVASNVTPAECWKYNGESVALPWCNNASGNIQNLCNFENGAYIWDEDTTGLSFQPYLLYIVRKICEAIKYDITGLEKWEQNEAHKYLLICNALPEAWEIPGYARALPRWSVTDFFEKLELFLGCEFDIDHHTKKIKFDYTRDILDLVKPIEIKDITNELEQELTPEEDDMDCDYIEANNLVYKECSHNMWKYMSCDWYTKTKKGKEVQYVEPEGREITEAYKSSTEVVAFDNMDDFLNVEKNVIEQSKIGSYHRNSMANKLMYVKENGIYFALRAIAKSDSLINTITTTTGKRELYEYIFKVQPINLFGGRIVDESDDAQEQEIEFVPAWIDYLDEDYQFCLFLEPGSYNEDDTDSGDYTTDAEEWNATIFQPETIQDIEAGEKQEKSAYYDMIFCAFWDGTNHAEIGMLPFPIVDDILIKRDLSYEVMKYSMRINKKGAERRISDYDIDARTKYTFKFLADELPNVRSVFFIRGKKYICEKLTVTFSEATGMSQLIKGEFYRII